MVTAGVKLYDVQIASFKLCVSGSCMDSVRGRKSTGLDIAGPRAYCWTLL